MRMLRQYGFPAEHPFVHGFPLDFDAPDEFEHSTGSMLLRQVPPLRQDDELERLAFDPARIEPILRRTLSS